MPMMNTTDEPNTSAQDAVAFWTKELAAARKRETDYRTHGQTILERYDGRTRTPFNILFSNTETMAPALYSRVPIPVVSRRFKDEDPMGKAAAQAGQRLLAFLLDTNLEGAETFDEVMTAGVMNALLPGRGEAIVQYDAQFLEPQEPDEGPEPAEAPEPGEPAPVLQSELVRCESIQWDRVLYGYAKTWSKIPWIAYEQDIDHDEAERLFGKEMAGKLTYTDAEAKPHEESREKEDKQEQPKGGRKTCRIYQIWDKEGGKTVKYFCEQYKTGLLKEEEDPLQLSGFYPCPKPLYFVEKSYSTIPTALYTLYEEQANELNEITRRIKNVTKAIKAKGVYDGALGDDIKKLLEADDNEFVPADSAATMAEKGFDQAIWFMPVQELIVVLRELYTAREQCKQVIYEITGISDILRGSSKASETLGAQEIKTQWGTLRLKNKQGEVQRYAKDLLRIMLELAASKLGEESWAKMTGLPFLLSAQYNELTAIAQALQAQIQQQQMMQPAPIPGQPPQAPPPQIQQLQQIQQQLQAPQWTHVLQLLRDDLQRAYRIDIETNSTVEADAVDDQKQMQEVMGAIGQLLNGLTPLVVSGSLPFQAAQGLLLMVVRKYRAGAEIEDYIKAMQPPTPPDDGNGKEAMQQQMAMQEQQLVLKQKEAEGAIRMKQMDADMQAKQKEMALQVREAHLKVEQEVFAMQQQMAQEKLALRDQAFQQKTATEEKVRQVKDRSLQREQQFSKQADGKVTQSVSALTQTAQQVQQLGDALQQIQQQAAETQQVLAALLKAATAKRIKRAIRGADSRIERVEEEIVA